jgi:hypothetical protein
MFSAAAYRSTFALSLLLMLLPQPPLSTAGEPQYVKGTVDGETYLVRDDRRPTLLATMPGEGATNVIRFDAAYY